MVPARSAILLLAIALAGLAAAGSVPASAQSSTDDRVSSSYLVTLAPETPREPRAERRQGALAMMIVRPEFAITLEADLDPALARRMAVTSAAPFVAGQLLYGWRDHPGLYCDLMRNRGLGSSAACLRDSDNDGRFDTAVRFDFNSARADLVFITDKQKVRGGKLKREAPLAQPLPYRNVEVPGEAFGQLNMVWDTASGRSVEGTGGDLVDIYLSDGPNFTGTDILSDGIMRVMVGPAPKTIEAFGANINLQGFDAEGALQFTVTQGAADVPTPFVFRGYILNIIFVP